MHRPASIAVCACLLLAPLTAAEDQAPGIASAYPLLLDESYPIETSVAFHSALLHWLDSLAGLKGSGFTAGKTHKAHRFEYQRVLRRPSERDGELLRGFADVRRRFVRRNARSDPDALTLAFFDAKDHEEALESADALLSDRDLSVLTAAVQHFGPLYREIWDDGRVPLRFLERVHKNGRRAAVSAFLVEVARFFGVPPIQTPRPRLILAPVVRGHGTHAQAIGRHLLIEIRPFENLPDEVAPIVHENVHFLFHRMDASRMTGFEKLILASGPEGIEAWQALAEALPTAIAQGVADQRFGRDNWSMRRSWYHLDEIDRYAKSLFPLVKSTLDEGQSFDADFLAKALETYLASR